MGTAPEEDRVAGLDGGSDTLLLFFQVFVVVAAVGPWEEPQYRLLFLGVFVVAVVVTVYYFRTWQKPEDRLLLLGLDAEHTTVFRMKISRPSYTLPVYSSFQSVHSKRHGIAKKSKAHLFVYTPRGQQKKFTNYFRRVVYVYDETSRLQ